MKSIDQLDFSRLKGYVSSADDAYQGLARTAFSRFIASVSYATGEGGSDSMLQYIRAGNRAMILEYLTIKENGERVIFPPDIYSEEKARQNLTHLVALMRDLMADELEERKDDDQ